MVTIGWYEASRVFIVVSLFIIIILSFYVIKSTKVLFSDLQLSEKKYRNIFENMQDVFFQLSLEGIILEVSPSIKTHTGYTREELLNTSVFSIYFNPSDREKTIILLKEKQQLKDKELKLKSNSGTAIYVSLDARIILDEWGKPDHIDGTFRNITKRKRAEDLLKESEDRFSKAFRTAPVAIAATQVSDGKFFEVNKAMEKFLGFSSAELIGRTTAELNFWVNKDDRNTVINSLQTNGYLSPHDFQFRTKEGKIVTASYSAELIEFAGKKCILSVLVDITERTQAEEKLKRNEARLKEAQAIAHTGNWEVDISNGKHLWSDEFYKIFGVEKVDIQPSNEALLSFIHPDDIRLVKDEIKKALFSFKSSSTNFRYIPKGGTMRYGYTEWKFEFENDIPIRLYGIVQDINARTLAEQEREKMIADIVHRNKNFEKFAQIVSHDLRGPVASILGLASVLKNEVSEEERIQFQEFLFKEIEKLDDIIKVLNEILQVKDKTNSL